MKFLIVGSAEDAEDAIENQGYDVAILSQQFTYVKKFSEDGSTIMYCHVFVRTSELATRITAKHGWRAGAPLSKITRLYARGMTALQIRIRLAFIAADMACEAAV